VFCLWPRNKATEFWMGWWDIRSAEETEIPNVPHQDHVNNFFRLSRRSAQIIRTRGKNRKCRIFKGVMDRLMKRIQRVHPVAFCCRDFFLFHDYASAHKAANVCQFLNPQKLQPFITPPPGTLQIYLRQTIFCSSSWKLSSKDSTLRLLLRSKKP